MKLERFLNGLNGWQIAFLFVGVFVSLCILVVGLDYYCAHDPRNKTD